MRITQLKLPSRNSHKYIITGDWHSEYVCEETVSALIRLGKTGNFRLVINGDFLDAEPLMKKNIQKYTQSMDAFENSLIPLVDDELDWGNDMLDRLGKVFKHIYFLEGNHEIRYHGDFPSAYRHNFDYVSRLQLEKRGIPFVKYNDFLQIGKLRITHGTFHGMNHLVKHYGLSPSTDVMVGHLHRHEVRAFATVDGVRKSISLPCMREIDAHYLKNAPTNWSKGFIQATVTPDGEVHYCCYEMKNGSIYTPNGKKL